MDNMDKLEAEVDNIDWQKMRSQIDRALMENLAAEVGFPDYDHLEQASELVVDHFYVTHLSDGRWVWWNPIKYATEDPKYFEDEKSLQDFIIELLDLNKQQQAQLKEGLQQAVKMKRCKYCEHEFDPVRLAEEQPEAKDSPYCSTECAMESILGEIKED
jgi:hypothetical protein